MGKAGPTANTQPLPERPPGAQERTEDPGTPPRADRRIETPWLVQPSCPCCPWANPGQKPRCMQGQTISAANKEGLFVTLLCLTSPTFLGLG